MPARTLLRGGHIISMDPEIGDIAGGDVLIEDEEIAAVAPSIDASDCEIIDATGAIVIPGFVDSHRHTWETVVRGIAPDVTLDGYFALILDSLAREAGKDLRRVRRRAEGGCALRPRQDHLSGRHPFVRRDTGHLADGP